MTPYLSFSLSLSLLHMIYITHPPPPKKIYNNNNNKKEKYMRNKNQRWKQKWTPNAITMQRHAPNLLSRLWQKNN